VDAVTTAFTKAGLRETTHDEWRVDLETPAGVRVSLYRDGQALGRVEAYLEVVMESDAEEEARLLERWEQDSAALSQSLGDPGFRGAWGSPGYPADLDAVRACDWPGPRRVTLEYCDEGPEIPKRLQLVFR
jgi:hypothetical protein